jgi:hypothetical protein
MMTKHEVLVALGPGGTTELAERVLILLDGLGQAPGSPELGGLAEVCACLGKSRQQVGHWIAGRRMPRNLLRDPPAFPEPLVTLSATPVWDLATVRHWGLLVGILETPVEGM